MALCVSFAAVPVNVTMPTADAILIDSSPKWVYPDLATSFELT